MLIRYINIERLVHSIKTVIACLLGLLLTKAIGLAAEQWVIITILVVMCAQIYVGSVMQKAYLRFLGTLIGCLFAALTIIVAGDTPTAIVITIAVSSFIFSYVATKQENLTYAATLGAVTTAIIMLGQKPTLGFAFDRFLEISLGVFIATLVSQFVLPIHASVHLRRAQASTLKQLIDYYKQTLLTPPLKEEAVDYHDLDEEIVKSLLKQRQLAKESTRERLGPAFSTEHFMRSLYAERESLRAMTFMQNALAKNPETRRLFTQSTTATAFNQGVLQTLETLIKALEEENEENLAITAPSIQGFAQEIQAQPTSLWPSEQMIYLNGFLFSAQILSNSLAELATLYRVPIANPN